MEMLILSIVGVTCTLAIAAGIAYLFAVRHDKKRKEKKKNP